MLYSNPSQKIKVGRRGAPFTFIAHAGLPPGYSHTRQTPWSVFLDGSVAPVRISRSPARAITASYAEALLAAVLPPPSRG